MPADYFFQVRVRGDRSDGHSGGTRAMVLAGHLLNSLVRNIEICRERFGFDTNKNANKTDGWSGVLLVFSTTSRENFPGKSGIKPAV